MVMTESAITFLLIGIPVKPNVVLNRKCCFRTSIFAQSNQYEHIESFKCVDNQGQFIIGKKRIVNLL